MPRQDYLDGLKTPVVNLSFKLTGVEVTPNITPNENSKLIGIFPKTEGVELMPSSSENTPGQGVIITYTHMDKIELANLSNSYAANKFKGAYFHHKYDADNAVGFKNGDVIVTQDEQKQDTYALIYYKVIDPRIDLARFQFKFQETSNGLKAYAYTPRFQLHSVGAGDNDADLAFLTKLFAPNPDNFDSSQPHNKVIVKYADGKGKSAAEVATRFNQLAKRWQDKNPYSAMMAYYGETPVAMTMGGSGRPGVAELAIISIDEDQTNQNVGWNKGIAKELGMLLFTAPSAYRKAGYKLDGSELSAIMATARPDNGSAQALDSLGIPERDLLPGEVRNRYGAERRFFEVQVDDLEQVVENTHNMRMKLGL